MKNITDDGQLLIQVSDFEGPLDLLLHLIKTSEMDIYNIKIADITAQYLTYLHQMQTLQLDIAGEYFVMAANLMAIKAKLLLPLPDPIDEADPEPADPREALVTQLLEYRRYKQAAEELKTRAMARQQHFTRAEMAIPADVQLATVQPGLTPADLLQAFIGLKQRVAAAKPVTRSVHEDQFTITGQAAKLRQQLVGLGDPIVFNRLFKQGVSSDEVVTTFLAVLEMAKHRDVTLSQASWQAPLLVTSRLSKEAKHDEFTTD